MWHDFRICEWALHYSVESEPLVGIFGFRHRLRAVSDSGEPDWPLRVRQVVVVSRLLPTYDHLKFVQSWNPESKREAIGTSTGYSEAPQQKRSTPDSRIPLYHSYFLYERMRYYFVYATMCDARCMYIQIDFLYTGIRINLKATPAT